MQNFYCEDVLENRQQDMPKINALMNMKSAVLTIANYILDGNVSF